MVVNRSIKNRFLCGFKTRRLGPQPLKFLRAPDKLVLAVIAEIGEFHQFPALILVEDSKQEVVESTVLDIWECMVDKSLLQEEADQGGLVVWVPQRSQALEDASDAQVVVSVPVNEGEKRAKLTACSVVPVGHVRYKFSHVEVFKSLGPVRRPLDPSCCLTLQLDPVEVQHQLVGLQQIFLGSVVFQKSLEE